MFVLLVLLPSGIFNFVGNFVNTVRQRWDHKKAGGMRQKPLICKKLKFRLHPSYERRSQSLLYLFNISVDDSLLPTWTLKLYTLLEILRPCIPNFKPNIWVGFWVRTRFWRFPKFDFNVIFGKFRIEQFPNFP